MPSATYVARRPGSFSSLVESSEIGGLRLEAHPPARVLDRYFDTDDGELLRRGLALRVREKGGGVVAALRGVEAEVAGPPDADLGGRAPGPGPLWLPAGPLADAVAQATSGDPLRALFTIRQYRSPRVLFDGATDIGVATFDVVVYEGPGTRVVANEVEVDPAPGADPLGFLEPVFQAHGLERAALSKVARGVVRMPRTLSEPVLLLPEERRRLEAAAGGDDPALRRRAQVVLLDARGFRPDTIAGQTGLSMARVRHWRQRFREARLGLLDPDPAPPPRRPAPRPAAPRPAEPSADLAAPRPPHADPPSSLEPPPPEPPPPEPPAFSEGDGLPSPADPTGARDMASLLDLFSPTATETPLFGPDAEDEATDLRPRGAVPAAEPPPLAPPPPAPPPVDPYPVVLGPVGPPPARDDAFETVDLGARGRGLEPAAPQEALWATPDPPPPTGEVPVQRPVLPGETPLLRAAEATLAYHLALFDARAARFVATRAPSDARRLLVAAHALRLAVETFERALPSHAARRLVGALRPLVADLDAAVRNAQAAAMAGRDDLAREAAMSVAHAADRLGGDGLGAWGARGQRLVARLAAQAADGARRSDDAPLADDYVGPEGSAPTATRLSHVLGSAVWGRFEAVRAFQDDLAAPTDALAAHLAVALSGLHFVLGLAGEATAGPLREVTGALDAAERAVVDARRARLVGGGDDRALDALADIWDEVTSGEVRERLAAVVASI